MAGVEGADEVVGGGAVARVEEACRQFRLARIAHDIGNWQTGTRTGIQINNLINCRTGKVLAPDNRLRSLVGNYQLAVHISHRVLVGRRTARTNIECTRTVRIGSIGGHSNLGRKRSGVGVTIFPTR